MFNVTMVVITTFHLWIIFAIALALFVIISLILFYHWWRYRSGNAGVIIAGTIYLAISALLIALIFTALL